MTLLFDGQNAFFSERTPIRIKSLVIHLPKDASLFFNGICYFPTEETVHLPPCAVREGENHLALRINNRIFPTEGLYSDGESISPMGVRAEQLLLRQNERIAALEKALLLLEGRTAGLEKKATARMLFS